MKPRKQSTIRRSSSLLIAVSFAMSLTAAHAASLTWDGNGATTPNPDGGAGTWDMNTTANWWDGASNVVWPNAGTDNDAVFANTAGTVTLAGGVTANDLTFSSTGYLIESNTLTLNGATPTITTDPGVSATISSIVAGSAGLVKNGTGTLTLSGATNTYTGNTTVNAGTLVLQQQWNGGTITTASGAITEWKLTAQMNTSNLQSAIIFAGAGRVNKTGNFLLYAGIETGYIKVSQSAGALFDLQAGSILQGGGAPGFITTNLGSLNVASGALFSLFASDAKVDALTGSGTVETSNWASTITVGAANHTSSADNPYFTGNSATFSGVLSNGSGSVSLVKTGSGKQTLSGTVSYSGATTINAGTLELVKTTTFASTIAMGASNSPTLQLGSPLAGDSWTFARAITGGSATAKIEKTGLGTLILTPGGGSSFTGTSGGALTASGGKLYLNAAFSTAPAVSVAAGALFGGTSTAGNVTVTNTGTLEGGMGGSGTLTAANVTLGSIATDTATLKGTLSTTAGYKPLAVTNLTLNGGNNTVTLDASGAGLTNGTYYDVLVSTNAITAPNASSVAAVFKSTSRSYTPNVTATTVQLYYDAGASVYWTGASSIAWDTAATNWKLSGNNADTQFLAGDVVFFHDSPTGSTVDISSGDVSPASATFDNTTTTAYTLQGSNGIASGVLAKTGDGILTIANANSYSGGTTLNAGTLNLNNAAALGSGALVINGGVLDNTSGAPITLTTNNAQTWNSNVVFAGSNDLNLGSGAIPLAASRDVSVTAGNLTIAGAISGSASLSKSGGGTLTLSGASTYGGDTNVNAGTLVLQQQRTGGTITTASGAITEWQQTAAMDGNYALQASITLAGTGRVNKTGAFFMYGGHIGGNLYVRQSAGALFDMQAGRLDQGGGGPGFTTTNLGSLNVASGATIGLFASNGKVDALTGGGTIVNGYPTTQTLTVGAADHTSSADNPYFTGNSATFSGTLANEAGTLALTKTGSGTQILTGTCTYTGATTVNDGTLALAGTGTLASPTITVGSGSTLALADDASMAATTITLAEGGRLDTSGLAAGLTLGSSQNLRVGRTSGFAEDIKGDLVVGSGSLHIAGIGATAGTLTQTGKLTLGGSNLKFDLAATTTPGDGVNDLIVLDGDLELADSSIITINKLSGALGEGSYTLISCTGTLTGTVAGNLVLSLVSAGRQSYALRLTTDSLLLDVAGVAADLVWAGADATEPTFWDQNTTVNWVGEPDGKFADGDKVVFNDDAISTIVDIQGAMAPESVTFSNTTAKPYTLNGPGSIDGATGVTKDGNGMVTIACENSYAGPTTLNTGTINVNSATAIGTGALVINGGVLDNTSGAPLTLTTNNVQTWNSNVVFSGSNDLNLGTGAVTLTASADESVTAGTLTVGGAISGSGPLTKSGGGTLTLSKANTYTGGTTVNAGTLKLDLTRGGEIANPGAFAIGAAGNLELLSGVNPNPDTTYFAVGTSFTGAGTITKTGTGYLGVGPSDVGLRDFAGLIVIQQGTLGNHGPGWGSGAGAMDLTIAAGAMLDMRSQNVKVDALSGAGTVGKSWVPNIDLSLGNNDGSATFSGSIDQTVGGGGGNISLTKNGSGTQTLSNANNYGGGTIINAGTLAVSNITGSGTGGGAVTVQTTATLAGTGSISGNVSVAAGGFVAPGNAGIGTLTVASAALSGTYQCQLDVASGDQVVVSGALTVNSGAAIAVSTLGSPAAASYIIATYGSLSGGAPTVTGIPSGYVLDVATAGQIKLVKSGGGFSDWADSWTGPALSDKSPGGDPDGDGISNVLEYVIGGDPRVSSTSYLPGQAIVGTDLVLSYERSDASEADTTQTGQWSTNLTDWNDLAPVLVSENAAAPDSMEIRIPLTNAVGGKLFGRLNVTKP
jgi:autotransporter-associated beta strand protein